MAQLKNFNFEELAAAEKAATIVRKNYEDKIMMYRGLDYETQGEKQQNEFSELSQKLSLINAVRIKILNEMENKLLDIE